MLPERYAWRRAARVMAHMAVIAAPKGHWDTDMFDPFAEQKAPKPMQQKWVEMAELAKAITRRMGGTVKERT